MRVGTVSFLVLLACAIPALATAESIESMRATINLSKDGEVVVTEEIEYEFTEPRHGIFRYVTTQHPQAPSAWFRERYIEIEVIDVTVDGGPAPYVVKNESKRTLITIGDPETLISGTHRYVITYRVKGALSYKPVTEFYWNVTGADWQVPLRSVSATIIAPEGVLASSRSCYQGMSGKEASCKTILEENGSVVFSAQYLNPGEEMTVAQSLNPAQVEKVSFERSKSYIFWIAGLALWFMGLIWFVYGYKTAYRTGNTIIPEYEPYPGVKPMYAGLLMDGRLDARDITACTVSLAEQGYLKIKKTEKKVLFFFEVDDYEITLVKALDGISPFEKRIVELLFGNIESVGSTVALADLKGNLSKQRENQKILQELKKDLERDLEIGGFFEIIVPNHILLGVGTALIIASLFLSDFLSDVSSTTLIILGAGFLSLFIIGFMNRRRTTKGYEALEHLEGFKDFLSVTDKDRFEFHNAPQKNPEQFMKYLPYAIAFGVEEEWAEVFKDINIPNPDWYDGGSVGSFSATNLSTSIGAFSTAFAASSGTSASSGGGSAGGGGGGGGGGSW